MVFLRHTERNRQPDAYRAVRILLEKHPRKGAPSLTSAHAPAAGRSPSECWARFKGEYSKVGMATLPTPCPASDSGWEGACRGPSGVGDRPAGKGVVQGCPGRNVKIGSAI